jgi:hypothetical protein
MSQQDVILEAPQIHALMIVSGVSSALVSKEQNKNLRGTLTDKINVENFCYNYQNYVLHPTVQFSEGDAHKVRRPVERTKKPVAADVSGLHNESESQATSLKIDKDRPNSLLPQLPSRKDSVASQKSGLNKSVSQTLLDLRQRQTLRDIEEYLDPSNKEDKEVIKAALRAKAIRRLDKFFERGTNENCLLFLSGHGLSKATFVLNDSIGAHLTLADILQVWDRQPPLEWKINDRNGRLKTMRRHLLIIIDACNSGSFTSMIQKELRRPLRDVSIQTSSSISEKSYDDVLGGGGYFLNNLLYINGLKDIKYNYSYRRHDADKKERRDWQRPTFYSQFPELEQVFRLRIGFNRWEELEWRVSTSLSGTFIGDNGDIFKGEFKSIQLHGSGEKRLANGRVEIGTFRNDKLDGAGQVKWNTFECTGVFDRGRLAELYSARLSNGTELSMLDSQTTNASRYSVVIQDDMIQEITRLNETHQCSSLFEWIVTRYANSDTNKSIYKDGIRHGNSFHLKKDGGIIHSQWKNGVQHFTYSVDEAGRIEVSAIEFWDLTMKEKRSEAEGMPTSAGQKNDEHLKIFEGTINRLFTERPPEYWADFLRDDPKRPLLMKKGNASYEGEHKNSIPEGMGKFIDEYGNIYDGFWKDGKPNGKGTYKSANGHQIYEGFWQKGFRNGIGKMTFEGGDVYMGTWKQDIICGRGVFKRADWVSYEGFMFQTRTGPFLKKVWPARIDVSDKNYYKPDSALYIFGSEQRGDFPPAVPLKQGQLLQRTLSNEERQKPYDFHELSREAFYGEIKRGERSGFGRITTPDGLVFEGEFFEDMFIVENQRVALEDESRYEGSCLMRYVTDGNFAGVRLVYKDRFVFDTPHSKGKVTRQDGSVYEGDFVTKKRHGKGKLTMKNGTTYEGGFSQNNFSGQGKYTTADGRVFEGQFFENMLVVSAYIHVFTNGDVYNGSCLMSPRTPRDRDGPRIYDDHWVFKEMHGRGTLTEYKGDVYEGKFVRNKKHGKGILFIDGEKNEEGDFTKPREGEFVNNLYLVRNKTKTFVLKDGTKYTGDFLARRLAPHDPKDQFVWQDEWYFQMEHGRGKAEYPNGSVYEGDFEEGQKFVSGKLTYPNGEVYEGMFACEWKDPYGKYTFQNGDEYQGEFEFGEISGLGTYSLVSGQKFEGYCRGEKIRLFMEKVICRDGSTYTGWCLTERLKAPDTKSQNVVDKCWKFLSRDGFGTLTRADGSVFTGHFQKNLKCGEGLLMYANGAVYRGCFFENQPDGLGKYIRQDGSFLQGHFKEGALFTGKVKIVFVDGAVFKSEWDREDFEGKSCVVLPDGDVLKIQKNPNIRQWLIRVVKSFPDWPPQFVLPEKQRGSQISFKPIGRAGTIGNCVEGLDPSSIEPKLSLPSKDEIMNKAKSDSKLAKFTGEESKSPKIGPDPRPGPTEEQKKAILSDVKNVVLEEEDTPDMSEDTIDRVRVEEGIIKPSTNLKQESLVQKHLSLMMPAHATPISAQPVPPKQDPTPLITLLPIPDKPSVADQAQKTDQSDTLSVVKTDDQNPPFSAKSSLSQKSEGLGSRPRLVIPKPEEFATVKERTDQQSKSVANTTKQEANLDGQASVVQPRSSVKQPQADPNNKLKFLNIPKPENFAPKSTISSPPGEKKHVRSMTNNLPDEKALLEKSPELTMTTPKLNIPPPASNPKPATDSKPEKPGDTSKTPIITIPIPSQPESSLSSQIPPKSAQKFPILDAKPEPLSARPSLGSLAAQAVPPPPPPSTASKEVLISSLSSPKMAPPSAQAPFEKPRQVEMTGANFQSPTKIPKLQPPVQSQLQGSLSAGPIKPPQPEVRDSTKQLTTFQVIAPNFKADSAPLRSSDFKPPPPVEPKQITPIKQIIAPRLSTPREVHFQDIAPEPTREPEPRRYSYPNPEPKAFTAGEPKFQPKKEASPPPVEPIKKVDSITSRSEAKRRHSINNLTQIQHTTRPPGKTPQEAVRPSYTQSDLRHKTHDQNQMLANQDAEKDAPRRMSLAAYLSRPRKQENTDDSVVASQDQSDFDDEPHRAKDRQKVAAKLKQIFRQTIKSGSEEPQMPKSGTHEGQNHRVQYDSSRNLSSSGKGEASPNSRTSESNQKVRIKLPGGGEYEGGLENGAMSGIGALTMADGTRYVGRFFRGLFHGSGELFVPGRPVIKGYFVPSSHSGKSYKVTAENGDILVVDL